MASKMKKKSYKLLLYNSCIWIQTVIALGYSRTRAFLLTFFLWSEDPSNPRWIQLILRKKFAHLPPIARVDKSSNALHGGGLVGLLYCIEIRYVKRDSAAGYPRSLVVKQGKGDFNSRLCSVFGGSAREAVFYGSLVQKHSILSSCVPEIYYSRGNPLTGEYIIVMEDLKDDAVPAGHLLGNQCWGKVPLPMELRSLAIRDVLRPTFMKMAEIHAQFWRSEALLKNHWMKGVSWRRKRGKLGWEAAMENMRTRWDREADNSVFTALQRETMENLLNGTQWSRWQRLNDIKAIDTPFTLVHGDFHANNLLFMTESGEPRTSVVQFVDWSEVGIGCPFTELSQFMISNASIEFRRENEQHVFDEYYSRLVELGVDSELFPRAKCWERYKSGGIERWLQLLLLLVSPKFNLPRFSLDWFSKQVDSFLHDHLQSVPESLNTVYLYPL